MNPYGRQAQSSYGQMDTPWRSRPELQDEWGPLENAIAGGRVQYPEQQLPNAGQRIDDPAPGIETPPVQGGNIPKTGMVTGEPTVAALPASQGGPAMPGWDAQKWADPTHTSVKYLAGHFMDGKTANDESMKALAAYLQSQGYGVQYGGTGDTMTLSGKEMVGPAEIDMIQGYKAGGGTGNWQWLNNTYSGGPAQTPQASQGAQGSISPYNLSPLMQAIAPTWTSGGVQGPSQADASSMLAQILQSLQAAQSAYGGR